MRAHLAPPVASQPSSRALQQRIVAGQDSAWAGPGQGLGSTWGAPERALGMLVEATRGRAKRRLGSARAAPAQHQRVRWARAQRPSVAERRGAQAAPGKRWARASAARGQAPGEALGLLVEATLKSTQLHGKRPGSATGAPGQLPGHGPGGHAVEVAVCTPSGTSTHARASLVAAPRAMSPQSQAPNPRKPRESSSQALAPLNPPGKAR